MGQLKSTIPDAEGLRASEDPSASELPPIAPHLGQSRYHEWDAAVRSCQESWSSRHEDGRAALRTLGGILRHRGDPRGCATVRHDERQCPVNWLTHLSTSVKFHL